MKPFITNYQYNYIVKQADSIMKAKHNVNDKEVKQAFVHFTLDKVLALFESLNADEKALLAEIIHIDSELSLNQFKEKLAEVCIPFPELSDAKIKKIFRKVKKLHYPDFTEKSIQNLTYFGWNDVGANQKFIVKDVDGRLVGVHGRFIPSNKKGICHFCQKHTEVGLLTVDVKAKGNAMNYKALGNYVCVDNAACNHQITSIEKIDAFIKDVTIIA